MKTKFKKITAIAIALSMVMGQGPASLVASSYASDEIKTGVKDASANTYYEDLGYTQKLYNFDLLQFAPEALDKSNTRNTIGFEMYGRHNVAASTDNRVINLQIDERIAKHITGIEAYTRSLKIGTPQKRDLRRKADKLGRMTNIWQVNYIISRKVMVYLLA
jgi:hypothetical protein